SRATRGRGGARRPRRRKERPRPEGPAFLGGSDLEPFDPREPIETRIEAQDPLDSVLLHDTEMDSIAGGESPVSQNDRLRTLDGGRVYGEHLVHDAEQRIEGRLDGVPPIDRDVRCRISCRTSASVTRR